VQSGMGVTDPAEGELDKLARVDLPRLQQQTAADLLPAYVELTAQEPPAGSLPTPLPAPTQDEGNHLNYAGQWFIFALLTCIVYPLLLRRTARSKAAEATDDDEPLVGAVA
jgi:cytochrome oxidase assembly protein ShyY1